MLRLFINTVSALIDINFITNEATDYNDLQVYLHRIVKLVQILKTKKLKFLGIKNERGIEHELSIKK